MLMAERFIEKFIATFFAEGDFSRALKLAFLVVRIDKTNDPIFKEVEKELEYISEYTTEKLKMPFYKAWNIVSLERNPRKQIEIRRGGGIKNKSVDMTVSEIVVEVQKAHQRMYELMGKIAHKYDISIMIESSSGSSEFALPIID
jgi:hypothetical protein